MLNSDRGCFRVLIAVLSAIYSAAACILAQSPDHLL
jgi:hypothetical protein